MGKQAEAPGAWWQTSASALSATVIKEPKTLTEAHAG
jgi:hypothetical protein